MGERNNHLTLDERKPIFQLREAKMSVPRIAERLGRHRSTIHREIRKSPGSYRFFSRTTSGLASTATGNTAGNPRVQASMSSSRTVPV